MSYEYHYARTRDRTVRAWLPTRLSDGTWTWLTRITIHEVLYTGDDDAPDFWDVRSKVRSGEVVSAPTEHDAMRECIGAVREHLSGNAWLMMCADHAEAALTPTGAERAGRVDALVTAAEQMLRYVAGDHAIQMTDAVHDLAAALNRIKEVARGE